MLDPGHQEHEMPTVLVFMELRLTGGETNRRHLHDTEIEAAMGQVEGYPHQPLWGEGKVDLPCNGFLFHYFSGNLGLLVIVLLVIFVFAI